jgi:predicted lipoprotein with Yx(FWY)xxD motif
MRKSGFAAAAGLGSLVLLLTACGGSSGSSGSSAATSTAQPAGGATSGALNAPPPGSTVLHVQKSALGYVLALANGQVVYMYDKDTRGGSTSACTGSCSSVWVPVTGSKPVASPADTGLGALGTIGAANGAKQVTYNGMPLYTYKGAKPLSTSGNGVAGMWHVIKLSGDNIVSG